MTDNKPYIIPISEVVSTSWHKVKGAKGSIWAALGIIFLIAIGLGIISAIIHAIVPILDPIIRIISQIIIFLLQVGLLYIGIRRAADLPINYKIVFHAFQYQLTLKVIGVYLLQILILLPSVILFTIPVILSTVNPDNTIQSSNLLNLFILLLDVIGFVITVYLAIRMILSMAFVLDKQVNPWQAVKLSFAATRENFWQLIGIYVVQFCIVIISAIPLGIGLIWTIPFVLILYGSVYRGLLVNTNK